MTSALSMARRARIVSRSAAPWPAPTRNTRPLRSRGIAVLRWCNFRDKLADRGAAGAAGDAGAGSFADGVERRRAASDGSLDAACRDACAGADDGRGVESGAGRTAMQQEAAGVVRQYRLGKGGNQPVAGRQALPKEQDAVEPAVVDPGL